MAKLDVPTLLYAAKLIEASSRARFYDNSTRAQWDYAQRRLKHAADILRNLPALTDICVHGVCGKDCCMACDRHVTPHTGCILR